MPDRRDPERTPEALDRFLSDLIREARTAPAERDLDPTLAETVRRVHALDDARDPEPTFAARLWEDLMHTSNAGAALPAAGRRLRSNGHGAARPPRGTVHSPARVRRLTRPWSTVGQVATAAMLALTLLGTYVAFRALAPGNQADTPPPPDVPMYRGDAARTGEMPGPGPTGPPVELWRFEAGAGVRSAPAIVGGVLYVGTEDGSVLALHVSDGTERWRFDAGSPVASSPAVAGGLVYVGAGDGILYALDAATGAERWRFNAARPQAAPVVEGDLVVSGGEDGILYGLDAATGAERWRAVLGAAVARSAALADGIAYVGAEDGNLYAVDAATGAELWRFQTGYESVATPAVAGGLVFISGRNDSSSGEMGQFYAVDAARGVMVWRHRTPSQLLVTPAAISGDLLVVGGADGVVYALGAADGAERWTVDTGGPITAAPAIAGGGVYVGNESGVLSALDLATGAERWRFQAAGWIDYGPTVTGGVAYFGTDTGAVQAVGDDATAATPTSGTPALVADAPVEFVSEITGGSDPLSEPTGVAVDADGNLYVVDTLNDRIRVFDRDGNPVATWGESGAGPGQFRFRQGESWHADVAIGPDGSVYVADTFNNRIQKLSRDGAFVLEWGSLGSGDGQFGVGIEGVAVAPDGRVFVADYANHRVQVFDGDGGFLEAWSGSPLGMPNDIAFDAAGNAYVTDDQTSQVHRFSPAGEHLGSFGEGGAGPGQFNVPWGVAVDSNGNVYVVEERGDRVQVFGPDGVVIGAWGRRGAADSEFSSPIYVALDPAGYVYVADPGNNRVQKFRLLPPLAPAATPAT